MISVSDDLEAALQRGGYKQTLVADIIVDGERVAEDVPLTDTQLDSDRTASIRNTGFVTIEYSDELGRSVVPEDLESWLTPYATSLNISVLVEYNNLREKVLRGTYDIRTVGEPSASSVVQAGTRYTVGSRVSLRVVDRFRRLQRERFTGPTSTTQATAWDELAHLTGLALNRNVSNVNLPRDITYGEDRLEAVHTVGRLLEGTPYMNPNNELTIDPDTWGSQTEALAIGEDGTILRVGSDDLTDEGIYNQIVVRTHDADQVSILATAELTLGPLRYGGPFGRVPTFVSSQWVTTTVEAQAWADAELPRLSTRSAVPYLIEAVPDPRREVGDVVPFTDENGTALVGRIQALTLSDSGPMKLTVLVNRD